MCTWDECHALCCISCDIAIFFFMHFLKEEVMNKGGKTSLRHGNVLIFQISRSAGDKLSCFSAMLAMKNVFRLPDPKNCTGRHTKPKHKMRLQSSHNLYTNITKTVLFLPMYTHTRYIKEGLFDVEYVLF